MLATLLATPVSLKSVRCEQITLFRYRISNWLFPGLFTETLLETLLVLTGPYLWSAHRVPVISDMPPYSVSGTATT